MRRPAINHSAADAAAGTGTAAGTSIKLLFRTSNCSLGCLQIPINHIQNLKFSASPILNNTSSHSQILCSHTDIHTGVVGIGRMNSAAPASAPAALASNSTAASATQTTFDSHVNSNSAYGQRQGKNLQGFVICMLDGSFSAKLSSSAPGSSATYVCIAGSYAPNSEEKQFVQMLVALPRDLFQQVIYFT